MKIAEHTCKHMEVDSVAAMYAKHAQLMERRGENYFDVESPQVMSIIPPDCWRILEIGCGAGGNLIGAKKRLTEMGRRCEIVGVEIEAGAAAIARERLDGLVQMNAESQPFTAYPKDYFDLVIMNYVLEHVVNPWAFLRKWLPYLKIGGTLIVGVPNICNYRVLDRIVFRNDFAHEPAGILDWTHLRYYTRVSLERMLRDAGLTIERDALEPNRRRLTRLLVRIFPVFDRFLRVSYVVAARKRAEVDAADYMPFDQTYTLS